MKLVIKEEVNLIGEVRTSSYTVLTNPVTEYNNIPMSIGQAKGDLIVFKGPGEPVRFSAGSANGKVPMTDNTSPTGWTLGDGGGGGGGASATLHNGTGAQLLAGTVVYAEEVNGKLEAHKADAYTDQRLYILNDDLADDAEGEASFVPGSVASVLCDTYEVIYGDPMRVSDTAGLACATDGNATVGYALTEKDPGATGLVKVRLIENHTKKVINKSGSSNMIGAVYTIPGGDTGGIPHAVLASKGKRPFGVQNGAQSAADGNALLMVQPGDEAVVRTDATEIRTGDWLVPSATTPGRVRNGSGYGIGVALEDNNSTAKLIRIKMYPLQYGFSPRAWWLPSGITEDQVLAAYQFVGRASEAEALINVNNGTEYALTKSGATVVWNQSTGLYFTGTGDVLTNSALTDQWQDLLSAAFGYSGATDAGISGGIGWRNYRQLQIRALGYNSTNINAHTISRPSTISSPQKAGTFYTEGILGGNWDSTPILYHNGEVIATTASSTNIGDMNVSNARVLGQYASTSKAFYCTAIAFYKTLLTSEQHLELANNIKALGGAGA